MLTWENWNRGKFMREFGFFSRSVLVILVQSSWSLFVPTPLVGEELYTQLGFCSDSFRWSIYSSYRNVSGIIKKLVQRKIHNWKDFLNFVVFEEFLRIEVLCEHGILGMILFAFSVICPQIKILILKNVIQNYISRDKNKKFLSF